MSFKKEKVCVVTVRDDAQDAELVFKASEAVGKGKVALTKGTEGVYELKDLKEAIKEIEEFEEGERIAGVHLP